MANNQEGREMIRGRDDNGSVFIAWEQSGGFKRAWLNQREGEKDWAQTGRYLNVARTATLGGRPSGDSADFPISDDRLDRQILDAIAAAVCAASGCHIPNAAYPSH